MSLPGSLTFERESSGCSCIRSGMPDPMQMPVRSGFGRRSSLCGRTIEPNHIDGHIGRCPHVSEQVIAAVGPFRRLR
jgi:hypothetical protein